MSTELLYEGKAKKVFKTAIADQLRLEFKDALTAFNAQKLGSFPHKGAINRDIATLIFKYLKGQGIESHWLESPGEREMLVQSLRMIPLEVVIRNRLAGSTAKKFGLAEGQTLKHSLVELYFKKDDLNDPFISDEQALVFEIATSDQLKEMKHNALQVNQALRTLFERAGLELIDFKIEYGLDPKGRILLADEITPDSCRLWDLKTQEKMDKDRFRRDLGGVDQAYQEVLQRLKAAL